MHYYSVGQFARLVGVSVNTLRIWDKQGILIPFRTPNGHRRYSKEMVRVALKSTNSQTTELLTDKQRGSTEL